MTKKGLFISLEGLDGCGKSTQAEMLKDYLALKGYDVVLLREPGGTKIGEKIREIILDTVNIEMSPATEMLLYAASRAQLVSELIVPEINKGKIVICDRYVDSSIVYQGFGRDLGSEFVTNANKVAFSLALPDLTLFFEISPQKAMQRKKEHKELDRIELEKIDFHSKVNEGYQYLVKKDEKRFHVIDAEAGILSTFDKVKKVVDSIVKEE